MDTTGTVDDSRGVFVINPLHLAPEVEGALVHYVAQLKANEGLSTALARRLLQDHQDDR